MNRKELAEKRKDILRQINKLAAPVDPNRKQRDKLLEELDRIDRVDENRFDSAVRETRRLLKDDIKELEGMCKGTFYGVLPVKAKVRVRLNIAPFSLDTYASTCGVQIEFPKGRHKLALFTLDDEEELSFGDIMVAAQAKGLLPDLDEHIARLGALHAKILKKIKAEAKRHDVMEEIDLFVDEVMGRG